MSRGKKLLIALISILVTVSLAVAAILIIPRMNMQEVEVYPVSRIREYAWGDMLGSYGNIKAGNMQTVFLNGEMLLLGIDVSAGDAVSVGDTLLRYDTTIQDLNIRTIRIQADILRNRISKATRELEAAKSLVASSPPPEPPAPKRLVMLGDELVPPASESEFNVSKWGGESKDQRLVFNCQYGALIGADFLQSLYIEDPEGLGEPTVVYMELRVFYYNNVLMFTWELDGTTFKDFDPDSLQEEGWDISKGVTVRDDQTVHASNKIDKRFGKFTQKANTVDYIGGPHYSQAQIDRMVNDKTNELANYRTELKMRELELETALAELGDGTVRSEIEGIVSEVSDPDALDAWMPVIVIQSGGGYRVEGTVSELNLDRVTVGQSVVVSSWMTGGSYNATITEIQNFPARYPSGSMGMENPLSSYYTFVAMIDTDEVLQVGDWVEIAMEGESAREPNPNIIYLPNAFIRQEGGRSYVMKADEEGRLMRQYVAIGKSLWGYATEIRTGITLEDTIAFPYGKAVKEGAPTAVAEGMYW
ncbi:MAG: hypothetical protein FWE66_00995 [Oscillospiraceae bacterium]|nr:hypothetical protein [Oscillospiraceae bacterium]